MEQNNQQQTQTKSERCLIASVFASRETFKRVERNLLHLLCEYLTKDPNQRFHQAVLGGRKICSINVKHYFSSCCWRQRWLLWPSIIRQLELPRRRVVFCSVLVAIKRPNNGQEKSIGTRCLHHVAGAFYQDLQGVKRDNNNPANQRSNPAKRGDFSQRWQELMKCRGSIEKRNEI